MNEKMREYIYTCPHCKEKMNDFFRGNFKGVYWIIKNTRDFSRGMN